jgi:alpha/beta superfamily hydrolase
MMKINHNQTVTHPHPQWSPAMSSRFSFLALAAIFVLVGCQPITRDRQDARPAVTEQIVRIASEGQTVVGTLALPAHAQPPFPVVLMLHGFTNVRDELSVAGTDEAMYQRAARVFGEAGMASLRIDFRGSGDSDGAWADTTFTGQIADTMAAIDYLATLPAIDMQRLGVLGFSQGGLVAAEAAALDPRICNVVLWSAVANAPDTYKHILSAETVAEGLAGADPQAAVPVVTQWGAAFELNRGFFADLFAYDAVAALARVDAPLLVVAGVQDTTVTPQPAYGELFLRYHDGLEQLVTVESDHVFNVLTDPGPAVFDRVVAATTAWLLATLVSPGVE